MLTKDKIFLVLYLDLTDIPKGDEYEYLTEASKAFEELNDESVQMVILPVRGQETRLDCINPVLLDEKQHLAIQEKIENYEEAYQEFLVKLNEMKEG